MDSFKLITATRSAISPYHRMNRDETLVASVRGDVVAAGHVGHFPLGAGPVVLAVADGTGNFGDILPAHQALGALFDEARTHDAGGSPPDLLDRAFAKANRAVVPMHIPAEEAVELWNYGSTLTVAFVDGFEAWIAHVGDSRACLVRGARLFRLTHDHTLVELMVRSGEVTPSEAASHQFKNVMLATLGSFLEVQPSLVHLDLRVGDRLMLCTNGVSDAVSDDLLADAIAQAADAEAACANVVDAVTRSGVTDHATILVAEVMGVNESVFDGETAEPAIVVIRDVLAEQSDTVLDSLTPPPESEKPSGE